MISRKITLEYEHRTLFSRSVFARENTTVRDLIVDAKEPGREIAKVIVFVDQAVAKGNVSLVSDIGSYAEAHGQVLHLVAEPVLLPGGEACKNRWELVEQIWDHINRSGICRHSYVLVIGGGAVLDLVGFAASTAHRGIRHVRIPTTTLSQADGGVGVKNGVNFFGKKNWVGTFSVPFAIINDFELLRSLPVEQRRAGIIEAIKVSLIRDGEFFAEMEKTGAALRQLEETALEMVIRRSAELHMNHIAMGGDPFELGSARPLDFGHWVAHKLEQISEFRIGHGEAVAVGMAVDLVYARKIGLLTAEDEQRVLALIQQIGFYLFHQELEREERGKLVILRGLEEFREHLGGQLTITLVTGIGRAVEVNEMDESLIPAVIEELRERFADAVPDSESNSRLPKPTIPATQLA